MLKRTLRRLVAWFLVGFLLVIIHTSLKTILPFPLSAINGIFAFWAVVVARSKDSFPLFAALPTLLILDRFTVLPFGVYTTVLLAGLALVLYIFRTVFPIVKFYTVIVAAALGLLLTRLLIILFLLLGQALQTAELHLAWPYSSAMLLEIALTAFCAGLFTLIAHGIDRFFLKRSVQTPYVIS